MKYRYLSITLLLAGISLVQAQETATRTSSVTPKINRTAAAASLANERTRLSNAGKRQAYLSNVMAQLEQSKSHLFEALSKAAPDKLGPLKTLMAETTLAMHLAHLSDLADGGSAALNGKADSLGQIQAESENMIHALLGDDGYAIYVAYQQSEPYRDTIEQLVTAMRAKGSAITANQQQAMLDAYMDALLIAAEDSAKDATPEVYAGMIEAERRALGSRQSQRFEHYLAAVFSQILSPVDFKLFVEIRSGS